MGRRREDHWGRRARQEGHAARSIYKLQEIQDRFRLISRGARVIDLGCAPGSWSELVHKLGGPKLRLLGVDLTEVPDYPGTFLQMSVEALDDEAIQAALGGPATVVLSDMAPLTVGVRQLDHLRQIELARMALGVAVRVLRPGGSFVTKVFDGEDANPLIAEIRAHFTKVKRVRPAAVRRESREFFVVAQGFHG